MAWATNMTAETELELVMAALLGDLEAFDALVRRFRGAVIIVAQETLGCRDRAEDVAQEVFLLAFKALPQLQDPTRFSSWLYAIARHRARRVAIQASRTKPMEPTVLDRLILSSSREIAAQPIDECLRRAERAYVPELLATLPPDFRVPLQLRYYEEWSVAQISAFLMLAETTVKWRLHKGRLLMRNLISAHNAGESLGAHEPAEPA